MRRALRPGAAGVLSIVLVLGLGCAGGGSGLGSLFGERGERGERPAWERPPPPPRDAPVVDASALHRTQLANGLQVIVLEDPRLPRLSLGVTIRRGADIEGLEEAGLAAFTTELMERGAGERDALALATMVDGIGGSLSVGAAWDEATAGVAGLSRDLDVLFEVLTDVVLRPRFAPEEAARVRDETRAALLRAADDPAGLASRQIARTLYPGHRYGLRVAGEPETVERLDAAAARAFHARLFTPGNAIFFASGDVDFEALLPRIQDAFGAWQPGPVPEPGPPPPKTAPTQRRIVIVDRPDLGQAQIRVAHEGIARSDERRIAASLLSRVLGAGGFSSRLMQRVRAEEGLTYSVGSGFSLRRHPGPFSVGTFTRVPEVRKVVDILLEEFARMESDPPGLEELGGAQSQATGRFALGLETSAAVLSSLVDLDVHGLPGDSLDSYRGRVRAVTPEEVAGLARDLLHPERAAIIVVGPAEALRPQLEGLGSVEVVQP